MAGGLPHSLGGGRLVPDKYEREIEEILSNSGASGPPAARRNRETPPDDQPHPSPANRSGRRAFAAGLGRVASGQGRTNPRRNSGALLLAGLLLLIAAALLGGGWLAWVGASLLAAGWLTAFRARRRPVGSAPPTRYWRGRPVEDDDP